MDYHPPKCLGIDRLHSDTVHHLIRIPPKETTQRLPGSLPLGIFSVRKRTGAKCFVFHKRKRVSHTARISSRGCTRRSTRSDRVLDWGQVSLLLSVRRRHFHLFHLFFCTARRERASLGRRRARNKMSSDSCASPRPYHTAFMCGRASRFASAALFDIFLPVLVFWA